MNSEQIRKRISLSDALDGIQRLVLAGQLGGEALHCLTTAVRRMWTDPVLDIRTLTDEQVDELDGLVQEVIAESNTVKVFLL